MISCIGLEMVKTYFKLFLGKNHSKCLSYTGECHIYGTDLFNASVDLDECGKFQNFQSELHIQNFQKGPHPAYLCKICV